MNTSAARLSDAGAVTVARFDAARIHIPVAVVANQAGTARGLYGIDDVTRVHHYIAEHPAKHGTHIDLGADHHCQRPGVWSFPSLSAVAPFILERVAV